MNESAQLSKVEPQKKFLRRSELVERSRMVLEDLERERKAMKFYLLKLS